MLELQTLVMFVNMLCSPTMLYEYGLRPQILKKSVKPYLKSFLSRIYTGDFFATRFEDFLCVKIYVAERLLARGETRVPRSRLGRIAGV